ncbi:MAG: TetR/AcrR family transcriptional regulator [Pseudomonadota bacterium]
MVRSRIYIGLDKAQEMMEFLSQTGDRVDMAEDNQTPPPLNDTQRRIIDAARELFMSEGFSAVSGDQLCKSARVSKTSLYKYFGDMTGVLAAVVYDEGDLFDLYIDHHPKTEAEFWETLIGFGTRLLTLLNQPFCLQLDRMMHEEARSSHALASAFYDNAYGRGHRDIKALISHGQKQGFIQREETAEDLADHMISMWEGLRYVRARLALTDKPFSDPKGWSEQCVKTLFPNYRAEAL